MDVVFLPDVLPDPEPAEHVDEGNEEVDGAHDTAGGVGAFRVLGIRPAGQDKRDQTRPAAIEAA